MAGDGRVYLQDPDVTLYNGDALAVLAELPDESVHAVACSPPFYNLRDYGVDGQIGLEDSPEEWAASLTAVFAEARRVLRKDGSLWIECGDSYAANRTYQVSQTKNKRLNYGASGASYRVPKGYKPKDLVGQPFVLAFALRTDGWYWRGLYPWHKPNAMPESAKDRCTTSHSYVLHFSKRARYFFDADAIAEPAKWERWGDQTTPKYKDQEDMAGGWIKSKTKNEIAREFDHRRPVGQVWKPKEFARSRENREAVDGVRGFSSGTPNYVHENGKRPRSVWTIPTRGYPGAHFATWPPALAERIVLASCPKGGTILDPFAGSGTTLVVARRLGRQAIGIELNESYCEMARNRLAEWWKEPAQPERPSEDQSALFEEIA